MSNMLIEKRAEFVAKLGSLEATRQAEIDAKVAEYRASLESTMPTAEIDKVKNVIAALDEVIGYESTTVSVQPTQQFQKVEIQTLEYKQDPESVSNVAGRPGMKSVFTPNR